MKENISKMTKRHQKEIDDLQANCKHKKISGWMEYQWAIGHFGYPVKVCEFCGKIVATKSPPIQFEQVNPTS
jgi:rubrerythrin